MKIQRRGLYALSTLTAAAMLTPSVDAQLNAWEDSPKPEIELYWGDPTIPASVWHPSSQYIHPEGTRGFSRFEARGTVTGGVDDHDDGVWVMLLTRVVVDPGFNSDPLTDDYWHPALAAEESTTIGGNHQPAIISQARFDALIDEVKLQDSNDNYTVIPDRMQPIIPASNARRWNANYTHWPPNDTRDMWQAYRVPQDGQVFNLQSMITRTITEQTGGAIDGEDMFFDVGFRAMDEHDMRLEVQAVFFHADSDSNFYTQSPPSGPQGTYLAVGTSTPVTYKFFDSAGGGINGKAYPTIANYTPQTGMHFVQAGQGFPIKTTFVTDPASATVTLNAPGYPPVSTQFTIFKLPGQSTKLYVPAWVPVGTLGEIRQLHSAFGDLAIIPSVHRDGFAVY